MHYDITSKFIAEKGKESLYRFFQKQDAVNMELLEDLPQELPDIKKGDFVLRVTTKSGEKEILIWEFKTRWDIHDVQNLMVYTLRARQKYGLPVKPVMFLFLPNETASGAYEDGQFRFHFKLVKMWEQNGNAILDKEDFYLYPFIPLMSDEEVILKAEEKLYNSVLNKNEKSELLTAMIVFAGLKSKDLSINLFKRRKDIMIESYAYEVFREDAMKSAREEVRNEVKEVRNEVKEVRNEVKEVRNEVKEARNEVKEARKKGLQETIQMGLEIKFGDKGLALIPRIKVIDSLEKLDEIKSVVRTAESLHQIESVL